MTSTSAKKKAPAKKKTAAKKAPSKKVVVPDYHAAAHNLVRELGFSNSPHPDHVSEIAALLSAAFSDGLKAGKG